MVLAKQVKLTNEIIEKNLSNLEADERKIRKISMEYYSIINRLREEYDKRKLPWLKEIIKKFETNLTYKKGEAFFKTSEPNKVDDSAENSERDTEFPRGSTICEQGTFGNEMYVLRSGAIDVIVNESKVASIGDSGTIIGEMALLLGEKRSATLKAKNNVIISVIKKEDLKESVQSKI